MTEVVITQNDDWAGIYVDGELKAENHSLHWSDVLDAVGIPYKSKHLELYGHYAERLEDAIKEHNEIVAESFSAHKLDIKSSVKD